MQREKRKINHKCIMLPTGYVNDLAASFNVSRVTIHSALHYRTNSVMANKIRQSALQNGGHIFEPKNLKNNENNCTNFY